MGKKKGKKGDRGGGNHGGGELAADADRSDSSSLSAVTTPQTRVVLHSLKSAAHNNGLVGTVLSYDEDAGRVTVRLDDERGDVRVKPSNVDVCDEGKDPLIAYLQARYHNHRNYWCERHYCDAVASAAYNTLEPMMSAMQQGVQRIGTWNTMGPEGPQAVQRILEEDHRSGRIGFDFEDMVNGFDPSVIEPWMEEGMEHCHLMLQGEITAVHPGPVTAANNGLVVLCGVAAGLHMQAKVAARQQADPGLANVIMPDEDVESYKLLGVPDVIIYDERSTQILALYGRVRAHLRRRLQQDHEQRHSLPCDRESSGRKSSSCRHA